MDDDLDIDENEQLEVDCVPKITSKTVHQRSDLYKIRSSPGPNLSQDDDLEIDAVQIPYTHTDRFLHEQSRLSSYSPSKCPNTKPSSDSDHSKSVSDPDYLKDLDKFRCLGIKDVDEGYNTQSFPELECKVEHPEVKETCEPVCDSQCKFEEIRLTKDEDGDTELHNFIIQLLQDYALTLICLIRDSAFLNIRNNLSQTPIHLAVITKQVHVVRRLMIAGAEVDCRDHNGNTPLHIAAKEGYFEIAQVLLTPVSEEEFCKFSYPVQSVQVSKSINARNYSGQTALHLAGERSHYYTMLVLLHNGADINIHDAKSGRSVLHYAAEAGNESLVNFLLQQSRINMNCRTYGGATPIMLAGGRGHKKIVELFKTYGAEYDLYDESDEDEEMEEVVDFSIGGRRVQYP